MFDCQSCPVMEAVGKLDEDNQTSWMVWQEIGSRFVVEWHLGALALEAAIETHRIRDRGDLLQRLSVIYDVMVPARQPETRES